MCSGVPKKRPPSPPPDLLIFLFFPTPRDFIWTPRLLIFRQQASGTGFFFLLSFVCVIILQGEL